jgi:hypothetical protein
MTKPTWSPTRCERILALIDACLADVDAGIQTLDPGHTRHLVSATVPTNILVRS